MMDIFPSLFSYGDWGLLVLRLGIGIIFVAHGWSKRGMWDVDTTPGLSPGMVRIFRLLSIAETAGGLAVIAGFLTQPAALGLALVVLGAMRTKMVVWKKYFMGESGWELDFILFAACIALVTLGPGSVSVDWGF